MPSGYVIANVEITDSKLYDTYSAKAIASVEKYKGEFMVRGGRYQRLDGNEPLPTIFIVKFSTYEQALAWFRSPEYESIKDTRSRAASSNMIVVEGVD
jgi:uncharacterized protein (DUF1330 family)